MLSLYLFSCLLIPYSSYSQNILCPERSGRFVFDVLQPIDNGYYVGIRDSVSAEITDNSAYIYVEDDGGLTYFGLEVWLNDNQLGTALPYSLNSNSVNYLAIEKKDNGQIYFYINDSTHTDPTWLIRNDVSYFPDIIADTNNDHFAFSPNNSEGLVTNCTDTDMDGTPDELDDCPMDSTKIIAGICGCEDDFFLPDTVQTDSTVLFRDELLELSQTLSSQIKQATFEASESITFEPGFSYKPDSTIGGNLIAQIVPIPMNDDLVMTEDTTICKGESVRIDAGGSYENHEWDNGANSASIMVAPNTSRTYQVTNINASGCRQNGEVTVEVSDNPSLNCPSCLGVGGQMSATLCASATESVRYKETSHRYYEVLGDVTVNDLHAFDLIEGQQERTIKTVEKYFNATDKVTRVISHLNPEDEVESWMDKPATVVQGMTGVQVYDCDGNMLNSISYDTENAMLFDSIYSLPNYSVLTEDTLAILSASSQQELINNGFTYNALPTGFSLTNDTVEVVYDTLNMIVEGKKYDATNLLIFSSITKYEELNGMVYMAHSIEKEYKVLRNDVCVQVVTAIQIEDFEPNFCSTPLLPPTVTTKQKKITPTTLNVFPNPTNGLITIEVPKNAMQEKARLVLSNLIGEQILKKDFEGITESISLDLYALPVGTYFVQLSAGKKSFTTKFIKH